MEGAKTQAGTALSAKLCVFFVKEMYGGAAASPRWLMNTRCYGQSQSFTSKAEGHPLNPLIGYDHLRHKSMKQLC